MLLASVFHKISSYIIKTKIAIYILWELSELKSGSSQDKFAVSSSKISE